MAKAKSKVRAKSAPTQPSAKKAKKGAAKVNWSPGTYASVQQAVRGDGMAFSIHTQRVE